MLRKGFYRYKRKDIDDNFKNINKDKYEHWKVSFSIFYSIW